MPLCRPLPVVPRANFFYSHCRGSFSSSLLPFTLSSLISRYYKTLWLLPTLNCRERREVDFLRHLNVLALTMFKEACCSAECLVDGIRQQDPAPTSVRHCCLCVCFLNFRSRRKGHTGHKGTGSLEMPHPHTMPNMYFLRVKLQRVTLPPGPQDHPWKWTQLPGKPCRIRVS